MKPFKIKELKEKSENELQAELTKLKADLYNYRKQAATSQLKDMKSVMTTRHNIARIHTVLTMKKEAV